ncbi:hypothetical protein ACI0FM_00725 [Paenochrobactrum sp. BZR 588]|uniref:hypothetical protein n=2 Tax=Paenochrobactrum TaxID=999488 RepID=UPI003852F60A
MKDVLMQRPVKWTIGGLIIIALLGATPFIMRPYVETLGLNSLKLLAKEGGFCETENCEEGVSYVIAFLETNYGLNEEQIKWCMGVDEISHYQLPVANGLKNALTDLMYRRCGSPIPDMQEDEFPPEDESPQSEQTD